MSAEPERPTLNQLVHVDVGDAGAELVCDAASRVEDLLDGDVLIAAPDAVDDGAAVVGAPLALRWTGRRGVHALHGRLAQVVAGPVQLWRVRPDGPVELAQRRRFARAPLAAPLTAVPVGGGPAVVVDGWLLDLGEGGLRARLESSTPMRPGTRLHLHLGVEGVPVVIPARLLRVARADRAARAWEAVIVFEEPVAHADRIRRTVLRTQVLARRGGR